MSIEQFANFAQTTLNGTITAGATALTVTSASAFPVTAQYRILIDSELMIVTAGAGSTTWTITRGAEGTTAAAHNNGATITLVLTAGALDNLDASQVATGVLSATRIGAGVNAQTGTSYTVADSDRGSLVTFSNSSPVAVMLPQAGSGGLFASTWFADLENRGAGLVTVTPSTSTIDGSTTLVLNQNQGVRVFSDGSNYFTQRGVGSSGSVSSVGLVMPSQFAVSGSPVTGSGTLTATWNNQSANTVLAGPASGAAAAPAFRALVAGDLPASAALLSALKGYVYGLSLGYVSTTQVSVGPGQAVDSAQAIVLSLSSLQTISTGTLGAINGLDRTAISGTVATNSANATVTGTSTTFTTAFNPISLGTGFSSSSTTLTLPAGFCPQPGPAWPIAVGDLIGNASKGFYRVTAIGAWAASGQTLTLVSTPGSAFVSTDTLSRIENAHFQAHAQTVRQINTITSDTSLALAANSSATESGATGYIGALPSVQTYLMVWLGTGGTGTGVWLSTQRTTPYGVSGYNSNVRRIGSVIWDGTTPTVVPFSQTMANSSRCYQFECANGAHSTSLGSGGAWTTIVASTILPPSAKEIWLDCYANQAPNVTAYVVVRVRGVGDAAGSRNMYWGTGVAGQYWNAHGIISTLLDGAQSFDIGAGSVATVYGVRYYEDL